LQGSSSEWALYGHFFFSLRILAKLDVSIVAVEGLNADVSVSVDLL
jgi:hypothetical protein